MPDYTFYVEDYLGEDIPEKEFPRFIRRAGDELRRMREMYAVAPRQGLDPELAESMALCAVADAMYEFAQEDEARGIAKVSVGSVSETYPRRPSCAPARWQIGRRISATRRATICGSGGGYPMNKLYRDTVTLYHADAAAQTVVRTVLRGVCWQQGRRENCPTQAAHAGARRCWWSSGDDGPVRRGLYAGTGGQAVPRRGPGTDLGRLAGLCARGGGGCGAGAVRTADAAAR